MALHLIIDGYNFIRQSEALRPLDRAALEFGRDALIDRLATYKKIKRHKITVVFDGSQKYYFPENITSAKGIAIRFSRHGETADTLIQKMVRRERERAMVVSADRELIDFADAQGAAVASADQFEEKLIMAEMMEMEGSPEGDNASERGTKKKGPSKRLPKSERRNLKKIEKL